jgi:hypothetical protein
MEGGVGPVGSAGSNCGEDRLPRLAEDLGSDFPSVLRLGSFVNRGTSPATAAPYSTPTALHRPPVPLRGSVSSRWRAPSAAPGVPSQDDGCAVGE